MVQRSPAEASVIVPGEVADTLTFLIGRWTIVRSIVDHRSGTPGTFEGSAALVALSTPDSGAGVTQARYEESGQLHFGSYTGSARRCFDYVRYNGTGVMISFADGRPFVDLDLTRGIWRSIHRCGEDLHEIVTAVRSDAVLEERWRVRGPLTNYDATTTFTRVSESSPPSASASASALRSE
jgi:hypothetical protein